MRAVIQRTFRASLSVDGETKGEIKSGLTVFLAVCRGDTEEQADYSTEVLTPMYENLYVKKFVLFANEKLKYYFKETIDGNSYRSDKETCVRETEPGEQGRYGRLNDILMETGSRERRKMMQEYALEDAAANHMFTQE